MRIESGVTTRFIYFVAVDSTDLKTRETGLTTFTVYRSRDGGAAAAMTTPTVNETDTTNMPGVYELLLDEDMTIGSGNDSEEYCVHITQASMAPVTRVFELYRSKITAGNTLDVTATGAAGIDWANVENPTTALDLSGTDIQSADTVTTATNLTTNNDKTGYALSAAGVDAIWDETMAGHVTADTAGLVMNDWQDGGRLDLIQDIIAVDVAGLDGASMRGTDDALLAASAPTNFGDMSITVTTGLVDITQTAADKVWATAARILTASTNFNDIAAGDVWAIDATTQQTQGTFGQAIGDPVADTTTIYQSVATDAAGDNVAIDVIAVKAETSLIVGDTNELQTDWTNGGRLDNILDARMAEASINTTAGAVDTVTTLTGHTAQTGDSFARIGAAGASLTDLGGMSTGMKAEVNIEVLDVMNTDTITLPGQEAPAAAPTHREAIAWIYKNFRNRKVQSATLWELYADDGTTVDAKSTVSDDGTDAEKAEIVTGP